MKIECCNRRQIVEIWKVSPFSPNNQYEFAIVLKNCTHCNSTKIRVHTIDIWGKHLEPIVLKNKNQVNKYIAKANILEKVKSITSSLDKRRNDPENKWFYGWMNRSYDYRSGKRVKTRELTTC